MVTRACALSRDTCHYYEALLVYRMSSRLAKKKPDLLFLLDKVGKPLNKGAFGGEEGGEEAGKEYQKAHLKPKAPHSPWFSLEKAGPWMKWGTYSLFQLLFYM